MCCRPGRFWWWRTCLQAACMSSTCQQRQHLGLEALFKTVHATSLSKLSRGAMQVLGPRGCLSCMTHHVVSHEVLALHPDRWAPSVACLGHSCVNSCSKSFVSPAADALPGQEEPWPNPGCSIARPANWICLDEFLSLFRQQIA